MIYYLLDTQQQEWTTNRTSCLLIHGVDETADEVTDTICLDIIISHIGVEISLKDIQRSHRVGPKRQQTTRRTKPRPIICRFSSIRKRMEVFRNKKNLKGKNILITESLTNFRYELFQKAKSKFGIRNVWTSEGRIFTKVDNNLRLISIFADLE